MKSPQTLLLLLATVHAASAATTFFSDNFTNGSTLNSSNTPAPATNSTSYELISSKSWSPAPTIGAGHLKFGIGTTTAGSIEVQALFASNAVALVSNADYIELAVTFTNTSGILNQSGFLGFGLYRASGVAPITNGLNGTATTSASTAATGGAQNWQGYVAQIGFSGANSGIFDRQQQSAGTANNNQDLVTSGSTSQSYRNPSAASIGATSTSPSATLTTNSQYTVFLRYTLTPTNSIRIESYCYTGPDNTGTLVSSNSTVTSVTPLATAFDGLALGWRVTANTNVTTIDINSIRVTGQSSPVGAPPAITSQPVPVTVPSGASCAFAVGASGFGLSYQWHRYNTNLLNSGNISGATTPLLAISPASAADVASGADGYWVTVSGTGGFNTNSTTNSLTLGTSRNLVWSGAGYAWDLGVSSNWLDGASATTFNYGDTVTFDDTGLANVLVTNIGSYLSAASVTVNSSGDYVFSGTGSIAGPGSLSYIGPGHLTLNGANSYSGGTTISNANAYLVVNSYNALGAGPVNLALAGGTMEVVPVGSASVGINGDVVVQDDFTIQFDGTGNFGAVVFGNLSGTAGKTLTINPKSLATTNRYRIYGTNTSMDANVVLNGPASAYAAADSTVLAPYNPGGTQYYNGVISGNGGIIQRAGGITILNAQNTYSGGTIPTTGTIGLGVDSTPTVGTVNSGPIGTGALLIAPEIPGTTGSGTVLAYGGARTIANALQYPSATNNQTLIVGGTNALTFAGPYTLNGNDGAGTFTNRILQVNNTALTTISGEISGTGFGLIKTGNGILDLTSAESYTGNTTISNGTLRASGSLNAASAVFVATNATLAGTGTINGPVTVFPGGVIAPGNSIGTLTINNNLTLTGNLSIEVNRSGLASDNVSVSGALTNAGSGRVVVTNLGAALVVGDTFTLFNKALTNGNAMSVIGGQVVWSNKLAINGTISVAAPVATAPTNISYSVSGNTLTLSWPANYISWSLQSNIVGVASSSNWFTLPNSSTATQFVITINPARSFVFYRLVAP